ncbi:MAG: AAA family ATPase, partial [Microbacteriaceae bacterium]|nr:AAA family ATPase [Microbacteriaceae bacterium]
MWISQLDLTQWRNHEATRLVCSPGVTVLVGPNGQGKTNVVEAIRYLSTLGSHRVGS